MSLIIPICPGVMCGLFNLDFTEIIVTFTSADIRPFKDDAVIDLAAMCKLHREIWDLPEVRCPIVAFDFLLPVLHCSHSHTLISASGCALQQESQMHILRFYLSLAGRPGICPLSHCANTSQGLSHHDCS